jgi:hypothetical protein
MIKKIFLSLSLCFISFQVFANDFFTGQKAAACEVILCLSTGSPPTECKDSLKKYFKILVKSSTGLLDPTKTLKARKNFLKICPNVSESDIDRVNTSVNRKEYSGWDEPVWNGPDNDGKSQSCIDYCQGHSECLARADICRYN